MLPFSDTGGTGIPLVLLHGMSGDSGLWDPFVPLWAPNYRVIALDLPGHGAAEEFEPGLVAQLRGVRDVLDDLGLRELVLVGHSMGTLPALLFRSSEHQIIRSIAIEPSLDVAGFASTLSAHSRVPDTDEEFLTWAHESWRHAGIERVPQPMRQFVMSHMHPRRAVALASWNAALDGDSAAEQAAMNEALSALDRPTLILYGSEPPPAERRAAGVIHDVTIEIWEGSGHWLPYVDINRFAERVSHFITSRQ